MVLNAFSVLLPVLFVMALGALAGRAKQFDKDQVQGLNALVLAFALPASLFV
jgi:predicted permease